MKTNINFIKLRGIAFVVSSVLLLYGLVSIFGISGFNQGIDFTGGITAQLSINHKKSGIKMLRSLFSKIEVQFKDKNGKLVKKNLNFGKNISGFESKTKKPYISNSYLIRIKNTPGLSKDVIEKALTGVLKKNFKKKTILSFTVISGNEKDNGVKLKRILAPLGITAIKKSVLSITRNGKINKVPLFVINQEFKKTLQESKMRNRLNTLIASTKDYEISQVVDFVAAIEWGSFNAVSSTIGRELEKSAFTLTIVVLLLILMYIAVRFNYKFGLSAIAALAHDVIFMLGVLSVTGKEINVPIVAAILTIIGYSLNDTIVVFDRVRENLEYSTKEDLPHIVNKSINQSLSRTIITSVTTLLAVLSIYFLAGEVLRDFAFALIIGILVGTYSSVFIAAPVYIFIDKLVTKTEDKKKQGKKKAFI